MWWVKQVLRAIRLLRLLGWFRKTQVDEWVEQVLEAYLRLHPEIEQLSHAFTAQVLRQELVEHPELAATLLDSPAESVSRQLQTTVSAAAEGLPQAAANLSPKQLEALKAEHFLRTGTYTLPPADSALWATL